MAMTTRPTTLNLPGEEEEEEASPPAVAAVPAWPTCPDTTGSFEALSMSDMAAPTPSRDPEWPA